MLPLSFPFSKLPMAQGLRVFCSQIASYSQILHPQQPCPVPSFEDADVLRMLLSSDPPLFQAYERSISDVIYTTTLGTV